MSISSITEELPDSEEKVCEVELPQAKKEKLKVIFVGPPGSGKSSVIQAILGKPFSSNIKQKDCYEYHIKKFLIDKQEVIVNLWDCSSEHSISYAGVKKAFFRDTFCAFIVVDLSQCNDNAEQVGYWANECFNNDVYQVFVIATKMDLLEPERVSIKSQKFVNDNMKLKDQSNIQSMIQNIKKSGLHVIVGSSKGANDLKDQFINLLKQHLMQSSKLNVSDTEKDLMMTFRQVTNYVQEEQDQTITIEPEKEKKNCMIF